ncbi:hypothetical protein RND81_05G028200 [Saponaria officinalis]|uniref:Retrotransposon Copia-like N-terminal domain-containing protein n=1 Tax=Saponaria officinalis TaxID=3572 RepID=A0AAW1KU76_SAPOF
MTNPTQNQSQTSSTVSVVQVENPGTKITHITFNGSNYDEWSRAFRLALLAKDKMGYMDGTIVKPAETADDFKIWRSTNALVMAWIYATIEGELAKSISYRPEAKQIWDNIRQRFSQENEARIYRLKAEISACRQAPTESIMAYYGRLTSLWDELMEHDAIPSCSCKSCPCDWVSIFYSRREKERVRDFLMGLDDRFDTARSQIIGITPLPNLNLVYNRSLQEEGVRSLSKHVTDSRPEPMAFAAKANHGSKSGRGGARDYPSDRSTNPNNNPNNNSNRPYCIVCQKHGHYLSTCYRVTGNWPEWWGDRPRDRVYNDPNATDLSQAVFVPDPRRTKQERSKPTATASTVPRAHMAAASGSSNGNGASTSRSSLNNFDRIDFNTLDARELEELSQLWKNRKTKNNDRLSGKFSTLSWIIHTSASHHRSGCLSHFTNLHFITPLSVGLPNGDMVIANRSGDIHLSPRLILRDVLYAESLQCNLISVSSLLMDTSLTIQFSQQLCLIQDRTSKMVIGAGEQSEGLYFLKGVRNDKVHAYTIGSLDTLELWHRRMGNPSSNISRFLPFINKTNFSNSSFHNKHCDICIRAKQTRAPFPLSSNNAANIFDLLHCAVYLLNRTPSTIHNGKTPYEMLFNEPPSMGHIRTFGCLCYAKNINRSNDKFAPRGRKCVFLGYPFGKKGWQVYDLDTGTYFSSRDVVFIEDEFPYQSLNIHDTPPTITSFLDYTFTPVEHITISTSTPTTDTPTSTSTPATETTNSTSTPTSDTIPSSSNTSEAIPEATPEGTSDLPNTATPNTTSSQDQTTTTSDLMGKGHRPKIPNTRLNGYIRPHIGPPLISSLHHHHL